MLATLTVLTYCIIKTFKDTCIWNLCTSNYEDYVYPVTSGEEGEGGVKFLLMKIKKYNHCGVIP